MKTQTKPETLLDTEDKQEATIMARFLGELTPAERREMLIFMQGVRFAKGAELTQRSASA